VFERFEFGRDGHRDSFLMFFTLLMLVPVIVATCADVHGSIARTAPPYRFVCVASLRKSNKSDYYINKLDKYLERYGLLDFGHIYTRRRDSMLTVVVSAFKDVASRPSHLSCL
jgi:hypothetical protein